eukprot:gene11869-biopygen5028
MLRIKLRSKWCASSCESKLRIKLRIKRWASSCASKLRIKLRIKVAHQSCASKLCIKLHIKVAYQAAHQSYASSCPASCAANGFPTPRKHIVPRMSPKGFEEMLISH